MNVESMHLTNVFPYLFYVFVPNFLKQYEGYICSSFSSVYINGGEFL